ncbi:hypothetical protein [Stenotrophomonas oahuensis]|uniref:Lipoprotein n=1 Tax=Stenotrophomonas oahuensis TaxID=3003271 RepID=A0ABY9YT37_9GAMM|nr:hypothetical protein [Stenotrophomonas sp. A5586]WNH54102.1 hypothetical protein PDM29_07445 [Stenotrophomonas sp. A5586]
MNPLFRIILALSPVALFIAPACAQSTETTQTNEYGCIRRVSIEPYAPDQLLPPTSQECLGPHLLEVPRDHLFNPRGLGSGDGYSLALDFPTLQPIPAAEREPFSPDIVMRTVTFDYRHVDRVRLKQMFQREYTPRDAENHAPEQSLDTRVQQSTQNGLVAYVADMDKVRAYYRAKGYQDSARVMMPERHKDWFIARCTDGEVSTVIKCTPKLAQDAGFARCEHTLLMEDRKTLVRINYPSGGLAQWREFEARAREMVGAFLVGTDDRAGAG